MAQTKAQKAAAAKRRKAAAAAKTKAAKTAAELKASYGYADAVINSNKELKAIFARATNVKKGTYTPARLQAAIRNSAWYKNHSESWRKAEVQRLSDPKSWNESVAAKQAAIMAQATAAGATMTAQQAKDLATTLIRTGADEAVTQNSVASYVAFSGATGAHDLTGAAGQVDAQLAETAMRNGVRWSEADRLAAAKKIVAGDRTVQDYQDEIRRNAISTYPAWADQLTAGQDMYEIADPYRKSMAAILEMPDTEIDMMDTTIRGALTAKGADGKPAVKTLWEFENDLRKDSRWTKTSNARDATSSTAKTLLDKFGFGG